MSTDWLHHDQQHIETNINGCPFLGSSGLSTEASYLVGLSPRLINHLPLKIGLSKIELPNTVII